MSNGQLQTIEDYLATLSRETAWALRRIRQTIRTAAPRAEEVLSFQLPTFRLHGRNLIHFAGWRYHVSLWPRPSGPAAFDRLLEPYHGCRDTVVFPLNAEIPYDLVEYLVLRRLEQIERRTNPVSTMAQA